MGKENLRLKAAIYAAGLRQCEVAHRVGVTEDRVSKLVTGRRRATPEEMAQIAQVLDRPVKELFEGEGESDATP